MGGKTIANSETKLEALKLQSSAYGVTIPVMGGVNRIAGNLIWYGDFKAIPHTSTQGGGGKGGVKVKNTTYTYSASVLMGICQGRVGAISRVWRGKEIFSGGWSGANVNSATESYTPPGSGAMTYTLAHASTLIGAPTISAVIGWFRLQLAAGSDYSVAAGVVTVLAAKWRGVALTITYSWGSGPPDVAALTEMGITLLSGDSPQSAPSWLSSAHPTEALGYPGLALVHAQDYDLGSGGGIENHSFEVQGSGAYRYGASSPDCNPWEFLADVLANARYGARMPSDTIEVQGAIDYVAAAGLLMSPVLSEQLSAAELVDRMCKLTNCAPVWTFDHLRIVPYGDAVLTGNGVTFTPNTTPVYDLNDDCWLDTGDGDPLRWERKEPSDRYNHVKVEFSDRANYYSSNIAEATDDADIAINGRRTKPEVIKAPWICDAAVARLVAEIAKQRSLLISGTGSCKLPWVYCLLECMDLVTVTDQALLGGQIPVRITAVGEDEDGTLEIEFEEWPLGVASPTRYPSQVASGYQHDYNAPPGSVQTPAIFEAPGALTQNGLELWVATTGLSANWGGCRVWVSLDGATYKQVATMNGGARFGTLSAAIGTSGSVPVLLKAGQLLSGTPADAAARNTLCFIGGASPEFVAYETATLTGALAYTLSGLQRGLYGGAAAAHSSGVPFVRCDDAIARSGPIDLSYIGRTVYLKFTSFNIYGGAEQDLASVTAYSYVVTGANLYGNAAVAAQATADGKINTYKQASAPVAEAFGDLWIDDDDGNKIYWWNGSAWVALPIGTAGIAPGAATGISTDTHNFAGAGAAGVSNAVERSFSVTPAVDCMIEFTATITAATVLPDTGRGLYWAVAAGAGSDVTLGTCNSDSSARQSFVCSTSFAATGGVALTFKLRSTYGGAGAVQTLFESSMRVTEVRR